MPVQFWYSILLSINCHLITLRFFAFPTGLPPSCKSIRNSFEATRRIEKSNQYRLIINTCIPPNVDLFSEEGISVTPRGTI
jgi:hypothetical protein